MTCDSLLSPSFSPKSVAADVCAVYSTLGNSVKGVGCTIRHSVYHVIYRSSRRVMLMSNIPAMSQNPSFIKREVARENYSFSAHCTFAAALHVTHPIEECAVCVKAWG